MNMWQKIFLRGVWVVAFIGAYFIVTSAIEYFNNVEPANSEPKISIEELEDRIIDLEAELTELQSDYDMVSSENEELRSSLEEVDTRISDIEWVIFE
jgi:chromosome segregation ATPase